MILAVYLCAALLLAAPASAGSFTQVVLLSNDTGVDVSKAQRELKKRLKLPGAVFVEPELPHELASAL
ncbi:MAG: hypothetical protein GWP91_15265 [Rhodobacterales bacterium]|nr:hypothetical protein [Rhodobacterales bacterium]